MALGRAFMGLGNDLMRIYEMEASKREQARREAIENARYEREMTRQTGIDKQNQDDRMFNRAQQVRQTIGPGETQDPNTGELLQKYGFATELDQTQHNETEGTVNATNPRRFSLPPNFLEKAQAEDQEMQRQAAQRQQEAFARETADRAKVDTYMGGLSPEQRSRAEGHRLLGGFDPTTPDWQTRNQLEHKQGLERIRAGQQDQIDPQLRQTLQILQLTKPDQNTNPEAYEMWSRGAAEQLSKYLGQDTRQPLGPELPPMDEGGLGDLPGLSDGQPGVPPTPFPGLGDAFSNSADTIKNYFSRQQQPNVPENIPMDLENPLPQEGSFDLKSILEEIQRKGGPNPRDPKYKHLFRDR